MLLCSSFPSPSILSFIVDPNFQFSLTTWGDLCTPTRGRTDHTHSLVQHTPNSPKYNNGRLCEAARTTRTYISYTGYCRWPLFQHPVLLQKKKAGATVAASPCRSGDIKPTLQSIDLDGRGKKGGHQSIYYCLRHLFLDISSTIKRLDKAIYSSPSSPHALPTPVLRSHIYLAHSTLKKRSLARTIRTTSARTFRP